MKPSERVPLTMQAVTDLIARTELPPGVFNLVNGDRTVVNALLENPRVRGFSLVGVRRRVVPSPKKAHGTTNGARRWAPPRTTSW